MLREFWNFHGDIAIPLEGIASSIMVILAAHLQKYTMRML